VLLDFLATSYASASRTDVCWRRLSDRIRANALPDCETSGALPRYTVERTFLEEKGKTEADVSEKFKQELSFDSKGSGFFFFFELMKAPVRTRDFFRILHGV
jgi:hypothetical protein